MALSCDDSKQKNIFNGRKCINYEKEVLFKDKPELRVFIDDSDSARASENQPFREISRKFSPPRRKAKNKNAHEIQKVWENGGSVPLLRAANDQAEGQLYFKNYNDLDYFGLTDLIAESGISVLSMKEINDDFIKVRLKTAGETRELYNFLKKDINYDVKVLLDNVAFWESEDKELKIITKMSKGLPYTFNPHGGLTRTDNIHEQIDLFNKQDTEIDFCSKNVENHQNLPDRSMSSRHVSGKYSDEENSSYEKSFNAKESECLKSCNSSSNKMPLKGALDRSIPDHCITYPYEKNQQSSVSSTDVDYLDGSKRFETDYNPSKSAQSYVGTWRGHTVIMPSAPPPPVISFPQKENSPFPKYKNNNESSIEIENRYSEKSDNDMSDMATHTPRTKRNRNWNRQVQSFPCTSSEKTVNVKEVEKRSPLWTTDTEGEEDMSSTVCSSSPVNTSSSRSESLIKSSGLPSPRVCEEVTGIFSPTPPGLISIFDIYTYLLKKRIVGSLQTTIQVCKR